MVTYVQIGLLHEYLLVLELFLGERDGGRVHRRFVVAVLVSSLLVTRHASRKLFSAVLGLATCRRRIGACLLLIGLQFGTQFHRSGLGEPGSSTEMTTYLFLLVVLLVGSLLALLFSLLFGKTVLLLSFNLLEDLKLLLPFFVLSID